MSTSRSVGVVNARESLAKTLQLTVNNFPQAKSKTLELVKFLIKSFPASNHFSLNGTNTIGPSLAIVTGNRGS